MKYRSGYKYQLAQDEAFKTSFRPREEIRTARILLKPSGLMIISEGYCWDGASGIVDRSTNLKASLGHDALYQLMRMDRLDYQKWKTADDDFCKWLRKAGAWGITAKLDGWGLRLMRGKFARPEHRKEVHCV